MQDGFDISNKAVLVVGGTRGIGLGVSEHFAFKGALVVATGRDISGVSSKHSIEFVPCEINNEASILKAIDTAVDVMGRIDVAIINAGIALDDGFKLGDRNLDSFEQHIYTNTIGTMRVLDAVSAKIEDAGSIIITGSGATNIHFPGYMGYSTSKASLLPMVKHAAQRLGKQNVRVNLISPGTILTEMQPNDDAEALICLAQTALSRFGNISDLVGVYQFLASEHSSYVTGSEILVDGGWAGGVTEALIDQIMDKNHD